MVQLVCACAELENFQEPGPLTFTFVARFKDQDEMDKGEWWIELQFWESDKHEPKGDDDRLDTHSFPIPKEKLNVDCTVHQMVYGNQDDWNDERGRDELYVKVRLYVPDFSGFESDEKIVWLAPIEWP